MKKGVEVGGVENDEEVDGIGDGVDVGTGEICGRQVLSIDIVPHSAWVIRLCCYGNTVARVRIIIGAFSIQILGFLNQLTPVQI